MTSGAARCPHISIPVRDSHDRDDPSLLLLCVRGRYMGLSGSLLQQERSEYPANNPFCVFVHPGLFVCHTPVPLPLRPELAFEHETFSHITFLEPRLPDYWA